MAKELMSLVSDFPYVSDIPKLKPTDMVMPQHFMIMTLSHNHWVDDSLCYDTNNDRNSNNLFAVFGQFSDEDPMIVRTDLVQAVRDEFDFFSTVGSKYLLETGMDLSQWLLEMQDENTFGDELALYALARRYNRHVIVYTSRKHWTTLHSTKPLDQWDTAKHCHLQLIYLGRFLYGTVREKGLYAAPTEIKTPPRARRGRPRKPKIDPYEYRRFEYKEDLSQPLIEVPKTRDLLSIPVDADDRLIIAELKEKASEIKRQCVENALTYAKELTDADREYASGREFVTEITENQNSMDEKPTTPDNNENNDSIDVDKVIGTLWINDALSEKKKCVILVDKLSPDHLYSLLPKPDIDPYSSLEDIGDTTSDEKPEPDPEPTSDHDDASTRNTSTDSSENSSDVVNLRVNLNPNVDTSNIIEADRTYCMRTRKPVRHTTGRPRRSCNETVDYRKLDTGYLSSVSISPIRKKPKPRADPKREPSRSRILAHQKRFFRKDPGSVARPRRYPIRVYTQPKPLPAVIDDKYDGSTETYESDEVEANNDVEVKPTTKENRSFLLQKTWIWLRKGKIT